ncbi:glycosyltransferase family 4 protein [Neisseria sp. Ec49-e6-T10]|uniref:glycosyltransferase family 4 protein n=1 Tax=Neisseria sp. Ec49-e6-T10 TaxID=3140744 RepID=UPI003EBADB2A
MHGLKKNTSRFQLIHIADLRTIGGVERILVDFIDQTPHVAHHLILLNKHIHPNLVHVSQKVSSISSIKHWFNVISLPKHLRKWHLSHLIKKLNADKILVWNQVIDLKNIQTSYVYYEHGSAWYDHSEQMIHHCFDQVQSIIAVSHAAKRMLQLHHHVQQDIQVIHNTLRPSLQLPNVTTRTLATNKRITLGVAGRLVPLKCIPLLIMTIKHLQQYGVDAYALIAGVGSEYDSIVQLIQEHDLTDKISLLGLIDNMQDFYQQIDLYICTSMHESFGLVCLEAFAYALPVIAANIDGLPEVIEHQHNGICIEPSLSIEGYIQQTRASTRFTQTIYYPEQDAIGQVTLMDPKVIAQQVINLLNHPEQYAYMSKMALHTAKHHAPFNQLCKNVLAVLKN